MIERDKYEQLLTELEGLRSENAKLKNFNERAYSQQQLKKLNI